MNFYGLLHVAPGSAAPVNLQRGRNPLDTYLRCAATCASSFNRQGEQFALLTNNASALKARAEMIGLPPLPIQQASFSLQVPKDIPFHSAHYKLDLYRQFGEGIYGSRVALVDVDTVLLRPFDPTVTDAASLVAYDITHSQVRDHGVSVAHAVSTVGGEPIGAQWWGGELMAGTAEAFAMLSQYIERVWPSYIGVHRSLHHQSDEAPTSAAIGLMRNAGVTVAEAGSLNAVARWWSARTRSPQPALSTALSASLLHLPADKPFLASRILASPFEPSSFVRDYQKHAARKAAARSMGWLYDAARGRPRKFIPRI